MKVYVMSLGAGLLVGVIYALIDVRSPAPPVAALVGLLGVLVGEQIPYLVKGYFQQRPAAHSWLHQVRPHIFGELSGKALVSQERRTKHGESES